MSLKAFYTVEEPEGLGRHEYPYPLPLMYPHPCLGAAYISPRTLLELKLDALSYDLRSKPNWHSESKDETILKAWIQEAVAQGLTERQATYVVDELQDWAELRDEKTGAQPSCFHGIWESDTLISPQLQSELIEQVKVLEEVDESEKDWHPGSDGQVLDLVHPSLFCAVYGRTHAYFDDNDMLTTEDKATSLKPVSPPIIPEVEDYTVSLQFCWLPTEFQINHDGTQTQTKALAYINNLHPGRKEMYNVIERCVAAFIPLFERVLAEVMFHKPWTRIDGDDYRYDPNFEGNYEDAQEENIIVPDVPEVGCPIGLFPSTEMELREGRLKIITKLANIHLTPEKPEYPGGSWHVEGMLNERIVASGIYYYDEQNITESKLAFRMSVPDDIHDRHDEVYTRVIWGLDRDTPLVQNVGSVVTKEGRCLVFPNIYQHQVSPFKLSDPTKPGHRKILVFFLVDPLYEGQIPTTSNVPNQRKRWAPNLLYAQISRSNPPKLPVEICDMVMDNLEHQMSLEEAKAYRLKLMKERTVFVEENNEMVFEVGVNMCEQYVLPPLHRH